MRLLRLINIDYKHSESADATSLCLNLKLWYTKKEELVISSSAAAKINITELFSNVFADNCHNGIKSSSISMDV